ncbi:MAG: 3'-5' exonuclease [Rickettsiales bacterium]|jgi:predicted PolB exonuclease-like 3'-5' exonuclease|nr:3'-5' exonuclease [Rickettsiales bacterium]
MLDKLFVFDIETIPDTDVLYNLTGSKTENLQEKRKELESYHMEVSGGNPFPRQPFHRVVSVSILIADIKKTGDQEYYNINKIGTISSIDNTEEEIVKKFFDYLCRYAPRLVSYNGRSFDLPVMKYRAMKYGVSIKTLFKAGDKWNNYSQRYSLDWHCDLLEALSDFGTSCRCKMNEVCSILGIPGKIGIDGSKVTDMFDAGKLKEIDNYCETDVLNTYLIYLNFCLLNGTVNSGDFSKMNTELKEYIGSKNLPHFEEFLEEWRK